MHPVFIYLFSGLLGYLVGAISNAVWVSKTYGVDILKTGSGNPGATNVKRVVGKKAGNLVFALDLLKGFVAAVWPLIPPLHALVPGDPSAILMSLAGIAGALLGHSFSIFIGFKGGKGVATAMGGMLAIMAPVVLLGIVLWVIVFYAFRYVSLASIVFAASLPVFTWLLTSAGFDWPRSLGHVELGIAIGIAALILLRHIPNIQRLLNGTEHQFKKKPSNAGASSQ